jgi:phage/plasmid-associated DNA primase
MLNTLKTMAKEDDPTKYMQIEESSDDEKLEKINEYIQKIREKRGYRKTTKKKEEKIKERLEEIYTISGASDKSVAELIYEILPDDYIYDNAAKIWFGFDEYGKCHKCYGMEECKRMMNKKILKLIEIHYECRLIPLENMQGAEKNQAMIENEHTTKTYGKIKGHISSSTGKEKIVRDLNTIYTQQQVLVRLNNVNLYVIGFNDGVYDFDKKCFRKAKKTELVSCTVGYNYKEAKKKYIKKVKKIISDIYPDKQEREYALTVLSQGLVGINHLQEFYMFIGNGSNGKTIVKKLMEVTLGQYDNRGYCGNISFDCFTKDNKNNKTAMLSNFAQNIYSRIVFVDEANNKDKLDIELIKKISGNDQISANLFYTDPQPIINIICFLYQIIDWKYQ